MAGSKIPALGVVRAGALLASICLASAGWAQQGAQAPSAGEAGSADHGGMGHEGMGHGGMGHDGMGHGGMGCQGGMMGHGDGMGGHQGGCMGGHQGAAAGDQQAGAGAGSQSGGADHAASSEKSGHSGMMMGHMMCRTTEHVDGRLAYLKAELKLADAQTAQWNAFAEAVRAATQKAGQFCASMHEHGASSASAESGGAIAQLGMMERMMTAHLEEVRAVKTAVESLYGVLSDEQKKTADQTMTGIMGFGMKMGGMGMMGGMGKM